ncbi:hypothetical protein LX82_00281 [Celeribacter halophilus]|uniref:Uncharacterized protein n=1 Tax=Celeribacter halophilus TaxID=576117 RepID=A0A1I3N454_9RHOB|nr:hypothetical protein LX82_00281 [Celeribacter halophilus]SFJ04134.1 hypothetical protein SAMN04488138_101280 [Celeribacter halophilus]
MIQCHALATENALTAAMKMGRGSDITGARNVADGSMTIQRKSGFFSKHGAKRFGAGSAPSSSLQSWSVLPFSSTSFLICNGAELS